MEPIIFTTYQRKPFQVEAVLITDENIEQLSTQIGELKVKPDGTKYIQVNRRLVPSVFRVYTGWWMTKMGDNIRCYSPAVFEEQFVPSSLTMTMTTTYLHPDAVSVSS